MPVQSSRARVFLLLKQKQKLDTSRAGILSALLRKPLVYQIDLMRVEHVAVAGCAALQDAEMLEITYNCMDKYLTQRGEEVGC